MHKLRTTEIEKKGFLIVIHARKFGQGDESIRHWSELYTDEGALIFRSWLYESRILAGIAAERHIVYRHIDDSDDVYID